jgi:glycosyltransferase involved in cell wall biosynthesis
MGLRILLVSNAPWTGTGYGTQALQLARHLRAEGHAVAIFANYGLAGSKTVADGFQIYPGALSPAGDDMLHGHADDWKADVVLILYDAFAMDGRIQRNMPQLVMFWQPVDCQPMSRADLEQFAVSGSQPVAMSRFGARMMRDEGLDPLYAPHGVDTQDTFVPAEETIWRTHGLSCSRADARAELRRENGIPADAFLVGMNVHNKDPERKAVFEQMSAFALLHRRHSDSLLLCHSMPHPAMSGYNLLEMAEFLGISDVVRWADPYSLLAGNYTQHDMAKWYGQLDLYSGASRGEGFGLPLIEAQACAVPVVTTHASAMTELVGPGWLVDGQVCWQRGHRSTWTAPDIGQLADAYDHAYDGQAAARSGVARLFAVTYDDGKVYREYWEPIWEDIEKRLNGGPPSSGTGPGWSLVK